MPRPRTCTNVLAVPRSIPTSADHIPSTEVHKVTSPPPCGVPSYLPTTWGGGAQRRRGGAALGRQRTQGCCGVGKVWAGWMIHLVAVFSTGSPRSSGLLVHPYLNSKDVTTTTSSTTRA